MTNTSLPFTNVGISQIGFYIPQSYVEINELANARGIIPEKLTNGLGLRKMAVCKADESMDVLIANALEDLWKNAAKEGDDLDAFFKGIDRIYLGTESAMDGAKPTATYALASLAKRYDFDASHLDLLDMTFACVGEVDALQNCIDYVRLNPGRRCVVVAADVAKYDLHSGGEYTQGAGAIACLIEDNPAFVDYASIIGVDTKADFDFYKPYLKYGKRELAEELSALLSLTDEAREKLNTWLNPTQSPNDGKGNEGATNGLGTIPGEYFPVLRKEPVYNGAYSNACYRDRMDSALGRFLEKSGADLQNFDGWVFHLPFCYQGRKIAVNFWYDRIWKVNSGLQQTMPELGEAPKADTKEFGLWLKGLSKTGDYQNFVREKIEPGEWLSAELGNMYTASIFFSLMGFFAQSTSDKLDILQLGYGSGSKSKVMAARLLGTAKDREMLRRRFQHALDKRQKLSIDEYERIHASY